MNSRAKQKGQCSTADEQDDQKNFYDRKEVADPRTVAHAAIVDSRQKSDQQHQHRYANEPIPWAGEKLCQVREKEVCSSRAAGNPCQPGQPANLDGPEWSQGSASVEI